MDDCVFCQIVNHSLAADIVYEDERALVILDKYPRTRGHLQLIPKTHYRWIYQVPEMGKLFDIAGSVIRAIIPVLGADHATLATYGHEVDHAHIWIVPQYRGNREVSEQPEGQEIQEDRAILAKSLAEAIARNQKR